MNWSQTCEIQACKACQFVHHKWICWFTVSLEQRAVASANPSVATEGPQRLCTCACPRGRHTLHAWHASFHCTYGSHVVTHLHARHASLYCRHGSHLFIVLFILLLGGRHEDREPKSFHILTTLAMQNTHADRHRQTDRQTDRHRHRHTHGAGSTLRAVCCG